MSFVFKHLQHEVILCSKFSLNLSQCSSLSQSIYALSEGRHSYSSIVSLTEMSRRMNIKAT